MLPPKGTIKNLGHASRGRRPKSAGAIKARTKAAKMAEAQAQAEHRDRARLLEGALGPSQEPAAHRVSKLARRRS